MTRTAGPWIVDLQAQESPLIRGGVENIDGVPQTVVAQVYPEDGDDAGAATMANATLIAAAPALYDTLFALREVLKATGWMEHHAMTRDAVNEALALAEWTPLEYEIVDDEPSINDEPPPDVGPPGSGAIITEYTGNEPGLEDEYQLGDGDIAQRMGRAGDEMPNDDVRYGTSEEQGEQP